MGFLQSLKGGGRTAAAKPRRFPTHAALRAARKKMKRERAARKKIQRAMRRKK